MRFDRDVASVIDNVEAHAQIGRRQNVAAALGPFDERERVRIAIVAKARLEPFIGTFEAKEIKVIAVYARDRIRLNQGEGGTLDLSRVAEPGEDPASKRRLAGPEIALEIDDQARRQRSSQRSAEFEGRVGVPEMVLNG